MPRPRKTRYITTEPATRSLYPGDNGAQVHEPVEIGRDEYEALRLVDYDGLFHDAAGEMLGVSRQTVGRILSGARRKLVGAFVEGYPVEIEGGDAEMMIHYVCRDCGNQWLGFEGSLPAKHCPACGGVNIEISQPAAGPVGGPGRGGRRRKWAMGGGRGQGRGGGRGMGGGRGGGRGRRR